MIPGLETGLVDGGATNIAMYRAVGLYQLAPNLALTYHSLNPGVIMANKSWFDDLSAENRKVIEQSFVPSKELRQIVRGRDAEHLDFVRDQGIVPYALSETEKANWRRVTAPTHKRLIDTLGGESQALYDQILEGKAAFARQKTINP